MAPFERGTDPLTPSPPPDFEDLSSLRLSHMRRCRYRPSAFEAVPSSAFGRTTPTWRRRNVVPYALDLGDCPCRLAVGGAHFETSRLRPLTLHLAFRVLVFVCPCSELCAFSHHRCRRFSAGRRRPPCMHALHPVGLHPAVRAYRTGRAPRFGLSLVPAHAQNHVVEVVRPCGQPRCGACFRAY